MQPNRQGLQFIQISHSDLMLRRLILNEQIRYALFMLAVYTDFGLNIWRVMGTILHALYLINVDTFCLFELATDQMLFRGWSYMVRWLSKSKHVRLLFQTWCLTSIKNCFIRMIEVINYVFRDEIATLANNYQQHSRQGHKLFILTF